MSYQVTTTDVAARPTAVVPATTTWQEFPALWKELLDEVWACLRAGGIHGGCRNVMLYRDDVPLVEEGQGGRGEQRRGEDVVVRQAGQDRQRVTALRPALAHPAAVAQAAVEQVEDFDVVAGRRHVGVGGDDQRRYPQTTYLRGEV